MCLTLTMLWWPLSWKCDWQSILGYRNIWRCKWLPGAWGEAGVWGCASGTFLSHPLLARPGGCLQVQPSSNKMVKKLINVQTVSKMFKIWPMLGCGWGGRSWQGWRQPLVELAIVLQGNDFIPISEDHRSKHTLIDLTSTNPPLQRFKLANIF